MHTFKHPLMCSHFHSSIYQYIHSVIHSFKSIQFPIIHILFTLFSYSFTYYSMVHQLIFFSFLCSVLLRFVDGIVDQNNKESLLSNVLTKLREIQKWFLHQKIFSFASSSVLIVYGAEQYDSGLNNVSSGSKRCEVKMIDFSHVYDTEEYDTNYQQGIESTIYHLERCLCAIKRKKQCWSTW